MFLKGYGYMEITLKQNTSVDLISKIKAVSDMCRISKVEKLLSDCLESMPDNSSINYIGELNRNDIMH